MVHYTEIVTPDAAATCDTLAAVHGLSFGAPVGALGGARVATAPDGSQIGVRAPLADHEAPIVRTYLEVADIEAAARAAAEGGALIAYGPVQQGDTGIWAITIQGGVQMGLWQAGPAAG